ncbi:PEPxxWA-CTERM sorting domain-containing protein [Phenylobacterium sp.]|uniref:PEPxxWA-CTERM sorting domain-containing protein n=1 Tax=Phenylobacterium sp. TaxID=1871053 RepID=UPI003D2BF9BC
MTSRLSVIAACVALSFAAAGTATSATVTVVSSAAELGVVNSSITFDGANDASFAAIQSNFGVTFSSATAGASPFITAPGNYSGIGVLSSRALGNTFNGLISDISQAPVYSASAMRAFDINFADPVAAFGLTVQGWGHALIAHSFTLYGAGGQELGSFTFAQAGLSAGDFSPNGFAGFKVSGGEIGRVRVAAAAGIDDFVAFDNITFVGGVGNAVPEPAVWALLVMGFAGVGGALRSRRRVLT